MILNPFIKMFGGKYFKKVLVTAKRLSYIYIRSANEIGMKVRYILND